MSRLSAILYIVGYTDDIYCIVYKKQSFAEESGEKDPAEPEAKAKGFGKTAAYLAAAFIAVLALVFILKGPSKKRKKKH